MHLDECSKKTDAFAGAEIREIGQVGDLVAERPPKRGTSTWQRLPISSVTSLRLRSTQERGGGERVRSEFLSEPSVDPNQRTHGFVMEEKKERRNFTCNIKELCST